jgi:hypothetical protein
VISMTYLQRELERFRLFRFPSEDNPFQATPIFELRKLRAYHGFVSGVGINSEEKRVGPSSIY